MNKHFYLQYGCGQSAPQGWRNFDASPTLRFERIPVIGKLYTKNATRFPENAEYGDIVTGLPVEAASCDVVYCSHVLEHLALADFRIALRNTLSLLRPGGTFRLVVPDLEFLADQYLQCPLNRAAHNFMSESYLGHERRMRGIAGFLTSLLGNSQHLWMWDYKAMQMELLESGFVDVRRAFFGDSENERFSEVESKDRWENCLGVECRRAKD